MVWLQVRLGTRCSADFCPDLTLTGGRGRGLGRAEANASCYHSFITHLLTVAHGYSLPPPPPPALIMIPGSTLMVGKGRPAWESLQVAYAPAQLVHLGPARLSLGPITF